MKCLFCVLVWVLAGLAMLENAAAHSLALCWSPSVSDNVVGYNVYYGTNSGNYTCEVDASDATSITLSNLVCGTTYYFAATAYDTNGDESPLSDEISFLVPGALCLSTPNQATGAPAITFPVVPGHWYEVQATSDLQNWTSIWQSDVVTNNVWTEVRDADAANYSQRFYRLVTH